MFSKVTTKLAKAANGLKTRAKRVQRSVASPFSSILSKTRASRRGKSASCVSDVPIVIHVSTSVEHVVEECAVEELRVVEEECVVKEEKLKVVYVAYDDSDSLLNATLGDDGSVEHVLLVVGKDAEDEQKDDVPDLTSSLLEAKPPPLLDFAIQTVSDSWDSVVADYFVFETPPARRRDPALHDSPLLSFPAVVLTLPTPPMSHYPSSPVTQIDEAFLTVHTPPTKWKQRSKIMALPPVLECRPAVVSDSWKSVFAEYLD